MKRKFSIGCSALIVFVIALIVISMISNLFLPESSTGDRLSDADKARLAEAFHLRASRGNAAWMGWGESTIPIIVYNEAYAFLVGYPGEPPSGWKRVPDGEQMGEAWEQVRDDDFFGRPYYRQPLSDPNSTPQAFTVQVGDEWVASLQTLEQMEITLVDTVSADLPGVLRPVVPYRLVLNLLFHGSDGYIAALLHESFHAYQGTVVAEHLLTSERMVRRYEDQYPWGEDEASWQEELDLLAEAVEADDQAVAGLAEQFLAHRAGRRERLNPSLIRYEQQREWLEGLAKYVELEVWRVGSEESYVPVPEVEDLDDFDHYQRYNRTLSEQIDQIRRMADDTGDGRFYYSGMAQAYLLDRLAPDWKEQAFGEDAALDELLATALGERAAELE